MLNAIEKLDQEMMHYYSINTLFQLSNITFNSDILFSKIENVFEKNTWDFIPNNAKGDIIEGGKALLFNFPTSASFMFLRALEDCIRKLYRQVAKNDKQVTFGQAIAALEKEITKFEASQPDFERQIDFLKYIKDEFRNPSAHPDKTFTQKEESNYSKLSMYQLTKSGIFLKK